MSLMKILGYTAIGLVLIALVLAIVAASTLLSGFVLATLWAWFIVPTLKVGALTTLQAAGIALVARFLTFKIDTQELMNEKSEDKWKGPATQVAVLFVYPLLALFSGWIIHMFI